MSGKSRFLLILCLAGLYIFPPVPRVDAAEQVREIKVDGLQRVTLGRLLAATEIRQGIAISDKELSQAIKDIFATGYFEDVKIEFKDGVLHIILVELPAIQDINIKGSKLIKEDQIREVLEASRIKEGEILINTQYELILSELKSLYAEQGRYGTTIEAEPEKLSEGNLVNINIEINEGNPAIIARINILGNKAFRDRRLKNLMKLRARNKWNTQGNTIKYSRTQLIADLDIIRRHYLNNGYAKVEIEDNVVNINRRKDLININIQITEGKKYKIDEVQIIGDTIIPREELFSILSVKKDNFFSQNEVSDSSDLILDVLGNEGYGLAKVNTIYDYDDLLGIIDINFYILPGQRTYIRNIEIVGNKKTQHTALRRYIRQYESAPYSSRLVSRTLSAIRRLPSVLNARVERKEVPNHPDKLDLVFVIEEGPSGNIGGGIFYSDLSGFSLSFSYSDNNFYGKGNSFSSDIRYSRASHELGLNFRQPFINLDGVSASYFIRYRNFNFAEVDIANYALVTTTAGVSFGYPFTFNDRISYGLSYRDIGIVLGNSPQREITRYSGLYGTDYDDASFDITVNHNSLNRGFKPTAGHRTSFSLALEGAVDGTERPDIYEVTLDHTTYFKLSPTIDELAISLGFRLAYFDTWEENEEGRDIYLPFYKHYYAGGINSVRGFSPSSLGPRNTLSDGSPSFSSQGGNTRILGRSEFIFPLGTLSNDQTTLRSSFFWDIGNVFNTKCIVQEPHCEIPITYEELRQSVGFSLRWYIAFLPLSFAISSPLNAKDGDRTVGFQLSLGNIQ